jgi:hypothetical protein
MMSRPHIVLHFLRKAWSASRRYVPYRASREKLKGKPNCQGLLLPLSAASAESFPVRRDQRLPARHYGRARGAFDRI